MRTTSEFELVFDVEYDGRWLPADAISGDYSYFSDSNVRKARVVGSGNQAGEILRLGWKYSTPVKCRITLGPIGEVSPFLVLDWREAERRGFWEAELIQVEPQRHGLA